MESKKLQNLNFSFTINRNLRIQSFSKEVESLCGEILPNIKGIPLSKFISVVNGDSLDDVKNVFKNGKPIKLKDCKCISLCGLTDATLVVNPLKDTKGNIRNSIITAKTKIDIDTLNRLKHSKRLLDIGKIASTLAHGVRSPLNSIKGSIVYLREKYASDTELFEFTNIIEDEISRLNNFIADFLSTSSIEESSLELDINQILHKIEILTSHQTKSLNIKSNFKYGDVPPIRIHPFYLEHAVLNIINNAIEAMPSGGKIRVNSYSKVYAGKEYAVIKVSDTGNGNNGNTPEKPLFSHTKKGKGMGLFITSEILRSVDGYLEMKKEKVKGTCVNLYIPSKTQ